MAGLVPAIRGSTVPRRMAGTVAGHDAWGDQSDTQFLVTSVSDEAIPIGV